MAEVDDLGFKATEDLGFKPKGDELGFKPIEVTPPGAVRGSDGMLLGGSNPPAPSMGELFLDNATKPFVALPRLEANPNDSPLTKLTKGFGNVAIGAAEGLESPLGVSTIAASALPAVGKVIGRTAAAGFGVKSTLEGFKEVAQAYQEQDWTKAGKAIGELLLGGVMVRGAVGAPKTVPDATKLPPVGITKTRTGETIIDYDTSASAKAEGKMTDIVVEPSPESIPLGVLRPEVIDPSLSRLTEADFDKVYTQVIEEVDRLETLHAQGKADRSELASAQDRYSAVENERFRRNIQDTIPSDLFQKLRREPNDTKASIILDELQRQGATKEQMLAEVKLRSPDEAEVFKGQLERIKNLSENPPSTPSVESPGPGAASPAEFAPPQPFLTSIKNATVDQERSARGLEPMMESARQSNPASWDKAMAMIDEMPGIQDSLIRILNSGDKVPGIEPVVQEALLLHRRIDLRNEFEKTARDLVEANEQGDPARIEQSRFAHARFEDMLDELESASKKSGTEIARGLQFRRQMAAQDFSLAGMLTEARAARGGRRLTDNELTEVERLHDELNRVQKEFDDYRAAQKATLDKDVAEGKTTPPPSGEPPLDRTALDKLAEVKQRQKEFKESNKEAQDKVERTPLENVLDAFVKWRRFFVLSGPRSLAKLASYSLQKAVGTSVEEGLQGALAKLPGISKIAEKSSTTGTSLSRELKSFKEGMTTGIDDAVQTFRTGNSKLDALYGEKLQMDPEWTGFFGRLHGAEKSPLKRVAFERSLAQRTEWAAKKGIDVTDPAVQMRLGTEAYTDALGEILMNPNEVSANVNGFIARLEGGNMGIPGKIAAMTARVLMPIQRVPLNFVARTWDYIAGLELGSIKAARALLSEKGIEELSQTEVNLIMKQLARGLIGTAAVLTGFLLPENFGGSFRPGVKREEDDVKALAVRLGGHDVPVYLVHNPLVYAMQFGATLRRVLDSKLRRKDEESQGLPPAIMAAMFGLAEETPYVREMLELAKFGEERTAGPAAGKLIKSLTVPLGVQWVAEQMDKEQPFSPGEEPVPRASETLIEQVETGIPGLRGNVPEKLEKVKRR